MSISSVLLPPSVAGQYCANALTMVTLLKPKVKFLTLEDADGQGVASNNHGEAVILISLLWKATSIMFLEFATFIQSLCWVCSCLLS